MSKDDGSMTVDITVSCPVMESFRVRQVAGMFDVPLAQRLSERFQVEIPRLADNWSIGLIVGPSGSGKSTIARRLFGPRLYRRRPWPTDQAVVDGLDARPIKEITRLFTTVGFGSPPSWIKPYAVLSNGEQFRCDLARALAGAMPAAAEAAAAPAAAPSPTPPPAAAAPANDAARAAGAALAAAGSAPAPLVVFDEFTSVVDRTVARAVSAALAKGIRGGQIGCRFVAVTCHYDVAEWLEPDWVLDMATSHFQRRCLRRPPISVEIRACRRDVWRLFKRHHYLSGSLSTGAKCFVAVWDGHVTAFCAVVSLVGRRGRYRISRLVTLPDYQGLGIGMTLLEGVAELYRTAGRRMNVTASHPALIAHCRRSPRWRTVNVRKAGTPRNVDFVPGYRGSGGRAVVSFEYDPPRS